MLSISFQSGMHTPSKEPVSPSPYTLHQFAQYVEVLPLSLAFSISFTILSGSTSLSF